MGNTFLIFLWIFAAMIAMSFWESYAEGRNSWAKAKAGWKFKLFGYEHTGYHFFLFCVMFPLLLTLPFVIFGWNTRYFGIVFSAYFIGLSVEDLFWYVVNPEVKFEEWFSSFSDYYPWIKIKGQKIIPVGYVTGLVISILIWYFVWR